MWKISLSKKIISSGVKYIILKWIIIASRNHPNFWHTNYTTKLVKQTKLFNE